MLSLNKRFNSFSTNAPLLYLLKTSENQRWYRSGTLVENRLIMIRVTAIHKSIQSKSIKKANKNIFKKSKLIHRHVLKRNKNK